MASRRVASGEGEGLRRPVWMMITARSARRPRIGLPVCAGAQILGTKLVNSGATEAEFQCKVGGGKPACTQFGEEVADQVGR